MSFSKLAGGRIIKTGIAVFITAYICLALEWPAIFAVITAIVTIEPTASDSVKKGMIRFPASVIGAAYSMIFAALMGDKAITYSLSAVFTIITCHRLKLDVGILVATLTAVNMIPITQDHFFDSFLVRLGTTTIGLIVSTVVNLVILPPHYSKTIIHNTSGLLMKAGGLLNQVILEVHNAKKNTETMKLFNQLMKELDKAEQLCQFQREEWKYHKHSEEEMRNVHYEHKKLLVLRQVLFHIGNILYAPVDKSSKQAFENTNILSTVESISKILSSEKHIIPDNHEALIRTLMEHFWLLKGNTSDSRDNHFTAEAIVLFELLSINDLVEKLKDIHQSEIKKLIKNNPLH